MSSLIIAAHPDDEVLGCGGTITRLINEKEPVYVAILGEGITSRYKDRDCADREELASLQRYCREVSILLGVNELFLYDLPDNRFDTLPLLDIIKIVEALIDKLKPSTIFTHHSGDLNIDHSIIHRATLTATRPFNSCSVKKVYAYEVPSSTEWAFGQVAEGFHANVFIDISKELDKKIEALGIYKSETRAFPHPRSPEAIRALAQKWGSVAGFDAAEAFELIREVR